MISALLLAIGTLAAPTAAEPVTGPTFDATERQLIATLSPLPSVPADPTNRVADLPAAVRLGEMLFFDQRLSATGQHACASCHIPALDFTDGKTLASATGDLQRNTPSLWNVAWQRWLFWDGRADTLWAQALQPIEHPAELASSRQAVLALLQRDAGYRTQYLATFAQLPQGNNSAAVDEVFANVGKALAAFQRRLITAPAPFDRFAAALALAEPANQHLPLAARRGLKLFVGKGRCILCHSGPVFSDGAFHATDIAQTELDQGRSGALTIVQNDPFNAAGKFSDQADGKAARRLQNPAPTYSEYGQFKTPGLRNVEYTAPYMHAGQLLTLGSVIEHYSSLHGGDTHGGSGILQPLGLTDEEKNDLVAFLRSLSSQPRDTWLRSIVKREAQN